MSDSKTMTAVAEASKVGCFQFLLLFLLSVNYVIVAMSHGLGLFHNYTPKFYCDESTNGPEANNRTYGCVNSESFEGASFLSRIWRTDAANLSSCAAGYVWQSEDSERSVVTEWKLICEKSHLSYIGLTIYYIGVAIGAWLSGLVVDRIGRLPVLAICLYTQGTMAVAAYIVQSYPGFLILRGLQGLFAQGLQNSTYILVLELFPKKVRTLVATTTQIGWALGLVLLATLSYFIPDWRILQLAVSVPTALTVLYIWIIPESPRWLLAKGKSTEADIALEKIGKYNAWCWCCFSSAPVKPERKSRLVCRALDETRASAKQDAGESTNLLTPPNPIQRKSRGNSIREITEKLEKRLSIGSNTESSIPNLPNREDISEVDESVEASIEESTRSNRESKISSGPDKDKVEENNDGSAEVNEIKEIRLSSISLGSDDDENGKDSTLGKNDEQLLTIKTLSEENGLSEKVSRETKSDLEENKEIDGIAKCSPRRSRYLTKHLTLMAYQWFAASVSQSVVLAMSAEPSNNRHANLAIGGLLELVVYVLAYLPLTRYGRRLPMSLSQLFSGGVCITVGILAVDQRSDLGWIEPARRVFLVIGRATGICSLATAYLFTVEIFPTVIRGACLGLCVISGIIGTLTAPYILSLENHTTMTVPLIIAGALSLISGLVCLALPETVNERLPDTAQQMGRKSTRNKIGVAGCDYVRAETDEEKQSNREILRDKLFSEDWVDAGNGIIVNFSDNKN